MGNRTETPLNDPAQDIPLSNTIYNAGYDVDRVDLAAGIVYLTKADQPNKHPAQFVL